MGRFTVTHLKPTAIFLLLLCSGNHLSGQEKVNMSVGIGFPEAINAGLLYQLEQIQLGINLGYMPVSSSVEYDNKAISISGNFFYHFGGHSELSKRLPWYVSSGIIYCDAAGGNNLVWLKFRVGRDINFSRKFGLSIDAGFIIELYNEEKRNDPQLYYDLFTYLLPSIGINLFYRIGSN